MDIPAKNRTPFKRLTTKRDALEVSCCILFEYLGLRITWLGHDGFVIENGKTLVVDPFKLQSSPRKADILLLTHEQ